MNIMRYLLCNMQWTHHCVNDVYADKKKKKQENYAHMMYSMNNWILVILTVLSKLNLWSLFQTMIVIIDQEYFDNHMTNNQFEFQSIINKIWTKNIDLSIFRKIKINASWDFKSLFNRLNDDYWLLLLNLISLKEKHKISIEINLQQLLPLVLLLLIANKFLSFLFFFFLI